MQLSSFLILVAPVKNEAEGRAFQETINERRRQDRKWGEQDHSFVEWISILAEEFGEASRAANHAYFMIQKEEYDFDAVQNWIKNYRQELIETAAVCIAAVENLDREQFNGDLFAGL